MRTFFILCMSFSFVGAAVSAERNPCLPPVGGGLDFSLPCLYHSPVSPPDDKVFFQPGSVELTPKTKMVLNRQAAILKPFPNLEVRLTGYADPREAPSAQSRVELGKKRAIAVRDYLVGQGMDERRIKPAGSDDVPYLTRQMEERNLADMRHVWTDASDP
ncbi:MAG: OmpA family protein [Alphaproteobacteria bacterium]|nr:OmpA family protein [Alphaproteobacteria bacterium]MBF0251711.1 OmpA family protein [Alphaproteobacteria bacterium]